MANQAMSIDEGFVAEGGIVLTRRDLNGMFERAEAGELPGRPGTTRFGRPPTVASAQGAVTRSVRLAVEEDALLRARAEREHTTPSQVMREALTAYLVPA
ncbi:MAG: hypothetical protein LBH13_05500 [Cellulomonadaceae bacterium]|nr:hypothetical protein [Cellulomonadaceae bacterium]